MSPSPLPFWDVFVAPSEVSAASTLEAEVLRLAVLGRGAIAREMAEALEAITLRASFLCFPPPVLPCPLFPFSALRSLS